MRSSLLQQQLVTNAYFSPRHQLLYIATPKVACTTLKWWFADLVGIQPSIVQSSISLESDPELVIHDSFAQVAPEYTGSNAARLAAALVSPDYFRFCIVRNPFTRIFSAWQSKWLLGESLQIDSYPNAFDVRTINSVSDIRLAFECFLRAVSAVGDMSHHDVHVAPQWALLEPEQIAYTVIGQIEDPSVLLNALTIHLGPSFRNPLAGLQSNVSLLPYSPSWISDESVRLIRKIYARDFELFGYDTTVPAGSEAITASTLGVALRSIKLLRGRNRRIGELTRRLSDESTTLATALSSIQLYWTESHEGKLSPYSEGRSAYMPYQINGLNQTLRVIFPGDVHHIGELRLDPSNQPAALNIHALSIEAADGRILWQWNGDDDFFQYTQGFVLRLGKAGLLIICYDHDPQCLLALPREVLASIAGGACLKIVVTPRPLHEVCADVLSQYERLISELLSDIEVNPPSTGISKELENVAGLVRSRLAKRDKPITEESNRLGAMRNELLRAEAQLDLLKDLMLGGKEEDRQ